MRIIAGIYRGKKLFTPESNDVRPTSDRARESVFNIINSKISGSWGDYNLLDLYSGSGAMGLEALSRGIKDICLIDKNTKLLTRNAALFAKEQAKIKILTTDATKLPNANKKYNLVFMDAPYKKGLTEKTLQELLQKNWLQTDALCVIEVEKNETFSLPDIFEIIDERTYGLAKFVFAFLGENKYE